MWICNVEVFGDSITIIDYLAVIINSGEGIELAIKVLSDFGELYRNSVKFEPLWASAYLTLQQNGLGRRLLAQARSYKIIGINYPVE